MTLTERGGNASVDSRQFNNPVVAHRSTAGMSEGQQRHGAERPAKARSKRKHRKATTRFGGGDDERRNAAEPRQQVPPATVHPDDLPQRARWTIIITAGLLLVTCMLLVGVTLRMAPVIDELGEDSGGLSRPLETRNTPGLGPEYRDGVRPFVSDPTLAIPTHAFVSPVLRLERELETNGERRAS